MQPNGWLVKTKVPRSLSSDEKELFDYAMSSGYFTHVTTLAEVKEQVLKYIPVMARPLVLLREQHPIRWTGVYADIEVSTKQTKKKPSPNFFNFKFHFPTYRGIEVTLAEAWSLANTNELRSSKTNLKFMQKQKVGIKHRFPMTEAFGLLD